MIKEELNKIAKQMVAEGKGLLAADESEKTVGKRFASINLENNEPNRKAFREMLLTAPAEANYISGVILHDETIRQSLNDKTFVSILESEGILPGIKVDQGLAPMTEGSLEQVTKGLDGLDVRLKEYVALGAKFCKWRSVITIGDGTPTDANILQNAKDLAQYALICQQNGLVPIVEPEVLLDGKHSLEQCQQAMERILSTLFVELKNAGVAIEGVILKSSMALPGKESGAKATPSEVAEATIGVFKKSLPENLPGVVFLSGGQGDVEATENLNAINLLGKQAWPLTFSYARALQDAATKTWNGKKENMEAAQKVFLFRSKMNSLASQGKYSADMEQSGMASATASASQN